MDLCLCNSDDAAALWAWRELARRGRTIELITADALAFALRWEHRLIAGATDTVITLADGRSVRAAETSAVLNRLRTLPSMHLRAGNGDREYAATEMHALFASWLAALPGPVLNRATPAGLSGSNWRSQAEWVNLAARSGMPVETHVESDIDGELFAPDAAPTLLVIGDEVLGQSSPPTRAAALRLARGAGLGIAGIALDAERGTFRAATPFPDLRLGGAAAIDALEEALR